MSRIRKLLIPKIVTLVGLFLCSDVACADNLRPALRSNSLSEYTVGNLQREEDYYQLAEELLDGEAKELFDKVDAFYRDINIQEQIQMIREVARKINEAPFVYEVYGLGFPFYGDVDMKKRIYRSLMELKNRKINISNFMASIVPDFDILFVHKASDEGPWSMSHNMDSKLAETFFREFILYEGQWEDIFSEITGKYKSLSRHMLFENLDSITEEFLREGKLHIDLVPVPAYIWKNMPVFIMADDLRYFTFIRDLLFTTDFLSKQSTDLPQNVPLQFRRNYILNLLNSASFTDNGLLTKVIELHPYRNLIELWPETLEVVTSKFKEALGLSLTEGLVYRDKDKNLHLTKKGSQFLNSILAKREEILQEGFAIEHVRLLSDPNEVRSSIESANATQQQI